jgi:hypothetical protein
MAGASQGIKSKTKPDDTEVTFDNAEEIVCAYRKTIEMISKDIATKYPADKYPLSLLPYPKDSIKKAFGFVYMVNEGAREDEMTENLKTCYAILDWFVPDDEAKAANEEILSKLSDEAKEKLKRNEQ